MKYPNGNRIKYKTNTTYDNRGMNLEKDINLSNQYYIDNNIAFIYKKPTPIQITKVDYPSRNKAVIKEAFFKVPSTTDYNGLYKGKYIDFEAKETINTNRFPLNNIHSHQIQHIKNIVDNGGISFIIVRFTTLDKTFLLPANIFLNFLNNNTRKSIPLEYFERNGFILENKYIPRIDYIKIVDFLCKEDNHGE